ncbi:response regulator [Sphingobacterium haloxyli]|uniref:DNA-binding response regulator n=1 Tax=Sphingobacterium haloxyli TaxID=2100533 RepID=A0A2S9J5C7_9SPHI|nr:response regulator transcription factor [Sphingobacterium haloxyli]PRD47939.1 DNA-binding response regulator [Sphingobacterium haloxyli]
MIRIFITDDHPIVLDGLKNLITSQEDMQLAGLFRNGADTIAALKQEVPDVLLLDINLPDISGIELSRQFSDSYPDLRIIVLSIHNEKAVIGSVLKNNVKGYLLKNSAGDEIIDAIHQVMEGETYLCLQVREIYNNGHGSGLEAVPVITRREKEVLSLIAEGFTSSQIADKLFISTHTVDSHRKNLMEKFNTNSIAAVVKRATEYKLF